MAVSFGDSFGAVGLHLELARREAPQDTPTRKLSPLKPANLPPICWAGCNLCADGALVLGVRGDGVAA